MSPGETVSGQNHGWSLIRKLGEGDAGEVYLAESLLDKKAGILKRPHRSAFSSDIIRQASQIEMEGKILRALEGVSILQRACSAYVPGLLDQSQPGSEYSERFFIVIEKAPGLDLNFLARAAHMGAGDLAKELPGAQQALVDALATAGEVPALVLLRALDSLIALFEKIHSHPALVNGVQQCGVIWNDVKPEHLFWNPTKASFTIIDWGNGQFLEEDGTTKDRRYSRNDDYRQFINEMGRFLSTANPHLHARLEWPANFTPAEAQKAVGELQERIRTLLLEDIEKLKATRQEERDLAQVGVLDLQELRRLEAVHARLLGFGELPEFADAEHYCMRLASMLCNEGDLAAVQQVCVEALKIPGARREKWELLGEVSGLAANPGAKHPRAFAEALAAGLGEDWPAVLWHLLCAAQGDPPPAWWEPLSRNVRRFQLQTAADSLTPYVMVSRFTLTLQSVYQKLSDSIARQKPGDIQEETNLRLQNYEKVLRHLKEEIVRKWNQVEPDPPYAGLEYRDIEELVEEMGELVPNAPQAFAAILDQPKAQVKIVMDAWSRKEFETARHGLRRILLWDPDRWRVLHAERLIQVAPGWLEKIHLGPRKDEHLQEFIARVELEGRELRNVVGPARWLDLILDGLTRLRKGARPGDLLAERPELRNELPWVIELEPRRMQPASNGKPVALERQQEAFNPEQYLHGLKEGALGPEGDLLLAEPLDLWTPEAKGSSARVFAGFLRGDASRLARSAIKVMRPDQIDYALPLFREEAEILANLRDVPGVTRMMECGFIRSENGHSIPADLTPASARSLAGRVQRYGIDRVQEFLFSLEENTRSGWLPYLAVELRSREDNLLMLCDSGHTHGRFLPVQESLRFAIQILDILQVAHERNIVYRDHKILHYYWEEVYNGVFVIDWNVARRSPRSLSKAEKQFDLVQFGARALHHIITGRAAPGALPLGPTRPEEIDQASRTYRVHWTYDDQRLPHDLREIIEITLGGGYSSVASLREDLLACFLRMNESA